MSVCFAWFTKVLGPLALRLDVCRPSWDCHGVATETVTSCEVNTVHRLSCVSVSALPLCVSLFSPLPSCLRQPADCAHLHYFHPSVSSQLASSSSPLLAAPCSTLPPLFASPLLAPRPPASRAFLELLTCCLPVLPELPSCSLPQPVFALPASSALPRAPRLRLSVHNNGGVISVQEALYGRADSVTCGEGKPQEQLANTECSLEGTMDILKSCDGKNSCIIKASNSVFGGPCPGTFKYLEVAYVCLS
ncbi:L-rhamnose-binding lectin SML-like [Sander lucioperca]|uniref:L-rhamnose-binding lectin SML-like n=1 Tax=Sander lucioperca TaxID=283035 RepID=UPI0016537B89|nr:L-rhamnose-binding lectin SML-like [Sander lucioperca]